jgi:mono/diheme cytochrome c family protein
MAALAPPSDPRLALEQILDGAVEGAPAFDPENRFSTTSGGEPVDDFDNADLVVAEFTAIVRDLGLMVNNQDRLLETARRGLAYLEEALEARRWEIDLDQIAADGFDGDVETARRAAGLFNAYCARCHTAGYSSGIAFTQEAGSGAFGPSLRDGRSVVQFPDFGEQLDFIVNGSENGQAYGVNGIGRGWMPGFGAVLSEADLRLIVRFARVLP